MNSARLLFDGMYHDSMPLSSSLPPRSTTPNQIPFLQVTGDQPARRSPLSTSNGSSPNHSFSLHPGLTPPKRSPRPSGSPPGSPYRLSHSASYTSLPASDLVPPSPKAEGRKTPLSDLDSPTARQFRRSSGTPAKGLALPGGGSPRKASATPKAPAAPGSSHSSPKLMPATPPARVSPMSSGHSSPVPGARPANQGSPASQSSPGTKPRPPPVHTNTFSLPHTNAGRTTRTSPTLQVPSSPSAQSHGPQSPTGRLLPGPSSSFTRTKSPVFGTQSGAARAPAQQSDSKSPSPSSVDLEEANSPPQFSFSVKEPSSPKNKLPPSPKGSGGLLAANARRKVNGVAPNGIALKRSVRLSDKNDVFLQRVESVLIEEKDDLISVACPCCHESFKEATATRMLDCNHTFCQTCLTKLCVGGTITCPRCSQPTSVEFGGIESLRPNYALGALAGPLGEMNVQRMKRRGTDVFLDDIGATCPVCMESFTKGRLSTVMSCGHSLCQDCLTSLGQKAGSVCFECPTCRVLTSAAHGSVNQSLEKAIAQILAMRKEVK